MHKSKYFIYLYTFKPCIFIELWCKNNKKGQYAHWLVAIFVLKCTGTIKFCLYTLNLVYLLKYKCKVTKKVQCLHWLVVIFCVKSINGKVNILLVYL